MDELEDTLWHIDERESVLLDEIGMREAKTAVEEARGLPFEQHRKHVMGKLAQGLQQLQGLLEDESHDKGTRNLLREMQMDMRILFDTLQEEIQVLGQQQSWPIIPCAKIVKSQPAGAPVHQVQKSSAKKGAQLPLLEMHLVRRSNRHTSCTSKAA